MRRIFDLISVGNIIIYIITKYCIIINMIVNTAFTLMDLLQAGNIIERYTYNKGIWSCWHGYLAYHLPFTSATPLELSYRQHKYVQYTRLALAVTMRSLL
jgi:hypothetical protein